MQWVWGSKICSNRKERKKKKFYNLHFLYFFFQFQGSNFISEKNGHYLIIIIIIIIIKKKLLLVFWQFTIFQIIYICKFKVLNLEFLNQEYTPLSPYISSHFFIWLSFFNVYFLLHTVFWGFFFSSQIKSLSKNKLFRSKFEWITTIISENNFRLHYSTLPRKVWIPLSLHLWVKNITAVLLGWI